MAHRERGSTTNAGVLQKHPPTNTPLSAPSKSLLTGKPYGASQTKVIKGAHPPATPPTNAPPALRSHPEGDVPKANTDAGNDVRSYNVAMPLSAPSNRLVTTKPYSAPQTKVNKRGYGCGVFEDPLRPKKVSFAAHV
ncbi:hypothetical protein L198_01241 [Cryptococcus wingfieldii CBS 7118]|uniref:Uncharacterized protein n=1 Tax=Cryptococcus wingfieldii CBS 7118 TaxID=1295528 RepID=A0A1E3JZ32_9TREE|nr:hypothetical protein L198_01241 [Cryptococcus wingfieldii CBS 7118]ODO06015.1 hypothetical protein L198_01241 [Cryptococcus wingfieldii CBS 7118]